MTAAERGVGRSTTKGCVMEPPWLATWLMTRVISSAYGAAARARCWARAMREAAMSSIARVIFLVDWTDLMRRRRTRIWAAIGQLVSSVDSGFPALRLVGSEPGSGSRCVYAVT